MLFEFFMAHWHEIFCEVQERTASMTTGSPTCTVCSSSYTGSIWWNILRGHFQVQIQMIPNSMHSNNMLWRFLLRSSLLKQEMHLDILFHLQIHVPQFLHAEPWNGIWYNYHAVASDLRATYTLHGTMVCPCRAVTHIATLNGVVSAILSMPREASSKHILPACSRVLIHCLLEP